MGIDVIISGRSMMLPIRCAVNVAIRPSSIIMLLFEAATTAAVAITTASPILSTEPSINCQATATLRRDCWQSGSPLRPVATPNTPVIFFFP